jgi:hypothetical protein
MSARPDCELPHHLAALGDLLLMKNDALVGSLPPVAAARLVR